MNFRFKSCHLGYLYILTLSWMVVFTVLQTSKIVIYPVTFSSDVVKWIFSCFKWTGSCFTWICLSCSLFLLLLWSHLQLYIFPVWCRHAHTPTQRFSVEKSHVTRVSKTAACFCCIKKTVGFIYLCVNNHGYKLVCSFFFHKKSQNLLKQSGEKTWNT